MTRLATAIVVLWISLYGLASAHEVRPAFLKIEQLSESNYRITWKQPVIGDVAVHLVPHISNGWLERAPSDQYATTEFLIRVWDIADGAPHALDSQTISIEGLKNTITDVLVRIQPLGMPPRDTIVRPEAPRLSLQVSGRGQPQLSSFVLTGVEHILTGPDHLLFLLSLILLVRDRWMLVKTVSAFTLAHSLTLAFASLSGISPPLSLLNALIALSILFVAPEVIRAQRGGSSLTIRYPWAVAFAFGLLHGMGFASGLMSLGLEKSALLSALLLFNVGVELGQLAFIALVLSLHRGFRLMEIRWPRPIALVPTYAVGILGAMWTVQFAVAYFAEGS